MKPSVSSYSFAQAIRDGRMTTLDVIPKAKEFGFEGVEFAAFMLPDGETARTLAPKLRDMAKQYDMPLVNYAVSADFLGNDLDTEVERLKGEVAIAHTLGVPCMRHDVTWGIPANLPGNPGYYQLLARMAEGCRRVSEYAAGFGIKTTIENHGYFAQDSERVEALFHAVNCPNFGLLVDMGNFMCADENSALAVARVARYAFHAHVKDFLYKSGANTKSPGLGWFPTRAGNHLRGTIIGHGVVPIEQCIKLLKAAGYDNWLSVEFEGVEDCLIALAESVRVMKELLQ